jgi:serine/threonine-protein kinase
VVAGNFRIDKLIGAGAMGNVYKAEQLSLGKAVAIKVLHPHLMGDDKLVGRFKREAKSASLLNHPNSIQIIDSGQDADGTLYIAMELLEGRDLAQVIRDDFPLPLPRVVRIMSQVLAALDEAHAQGVVHRDLKPSNIMLISRRDQKDFVKVCDFGIAKATLGGGEEDRAAMLTIQGLVCGTPEYMSPEQARAEPLDGRADLYSAAVILYQLLTGDIPFRAESPMGIVSRHLTETPRPPSQVRPDLQIPRLTDDVVLRGMEKNRDLRFPTALAFRDALEVMLNATLGPPTPLPPLSPAGRASMPTARDISGHDVSLVGGRGEDFVTGATGMLPAQPASQRFGPTADLTGQGGARRSRLGVLILIMLAASATLATLGYRARHATAPDAAPPVATAAAVVTTTTTTPPPLPPPAPSERPPVAAAPAPAPAAPAPAPAGPAHERSKHHRTVAHGVPAATNAPSASPIATTAAAAAATAPTPAAAAEPAPRGPREVIGEAEKLLGQGEVAEACARGEESKRLGPKLPAAYKFLGKCYMRAGRAREANDNYRQYLELQPNAPDAPFIKSIIK